MVENALGFALAAQKDFDGAVKHYKAAINAKSDYPVALNNLAFARERLLQPDQAADLYRKVLTMEPSNGTAIKRLKRVERQLRSTPEAASPKSANRNGF